MLARFVAPVVLTLWVTEVRAENRDLRILLSARLCVAQKRLTLAVANNRDLKGAGEDAEPLDEYKQKITDAKQAIKDAGVSALRCGDAIVKRVVHCLPEAGEGYRVGNPEDPACEKPSLERYLKAQ